VSTNGITLRTKRVKIEPVCQKKTRGGGRVGHTDIDLQAADTNRMLLKEEMSAIRRTVTFLGPKVIKVKLLTGPV
jgi:hypothetical protein